MTTTIEKLAPLATPLAAPPTEDIFTPEQWTTLMSIMDAVIPSIHRSSDPNNSQDNEKTQLVVSDEAYQANADHLSEKVIGTWDELDQYMAERPSEIPKFKDFLRRMLGCYVPEKGRKGLGFILSSLK